MNNSIYMVALFGFLAGIAGVWTFARQADSKGKLLTALGGLLALVSLCLGGFAWFVFASGM